MNDGPGKFLLPVPFTPQLAPAQAYPRPGMAITRLTESILSDETLRSVTKEKILPFPETRGFQRLCN